MALSEPLQRALTSIGLVAALGVIAGAAAAGWSRDLAVFFLALFGVPACLAVSLVCLAAVSITGRPSRGARLTAVLLLVASLAFFSCLYERDRVVFLAYWATHPAMLQRAAAKDQVIMLWDSWGFADGGNDAFLVADRLDASTTPAGAAQWAKRTGFGCPIVKSERMMRGIYLVTVDEGGC